MISHVSDFKATQPDRQVLRFEVLGEQGGASEINFLAQLFFAVCCGDHALKGHISLKLLLHCKKL